jgi:hypothetical protein
VADSNRRFRLSNCVAKRKQRLVGIISDVSIFARLAVAPNFHSLAPLRLCVAPRKQLAAVEHGATRRQTARLREILTLFNPAPQRGDGNS